MLRRDRRTQGPTMCTQQTQFVRGDMEGQLEYSILSINKVCVGSIPLKALCIYTSDFRENLSKFS